MLRIYSTDQHYITTAQTALDTLAGVAGAWRYVHTMGMFIGDWIEVERGRLFNAARGIHPHSVALIDRVIQSRQITRIVHSHANDASPERDFPLFRSDELLGRLGGSLMSWTRTTQHATGNVGTGTLIRWSGLPNSTANLSARGVIAMEACPNFILLAHELIHADRIGRGCLNLRGGNSMFIVDQRQDALGDPLFHHNDFQLRNGVWMDGTVERAEEIATVGLSDNDNVCPVDPLAITENMIRREHHLRERLKYGSFNKRVDGVPAFLMAF